MTCNIKLVSNIGEIFEVNPAFAKLSSYVNNAVRRSGEGAPVQLHNISSPVIRKIIEWVTYYNYDPPKIDEEDDIVLSQWDVEFLKNTDHKTVFDLVNATNILDFTSLNLICIKYISTLIKGKKAGQIRELFGIEDEEPIPLKRKKMI